jgi:hypothetical protein
MPDVHLPKLEDDDEEDAPTAVGPSAAAEPSPTARHRARSILKIALELGLIATGVFLGLAGEQWRENAHHRELAHESLRRLRTEVLDNRKTVQGVKDYHVTMQKRIRAYLGADDAGRRSINANLQGIQPAYFEHTAWDLALATQSLTYIDPDLAFSLSRVYGMQQNYSELARGVLQAMYLRPIRENLTGFLESVDTFYGDAVLIEPQVLKMYDEILPQIDRALGEARRSTSAE